MTYANRDAPLADRIRHLAPGRLFDLLSAASRNEAVDMALGVPEVPDTPRTMIAAACDVLREGRNQYEIPDGNPGLRRAIAATLPVETDPETELTITSGATEALTVAVLCTVDPGDEVVVFEPYYENFLSAVALAGGVTRLVPLHGPEWRYDPEQLRDAFGPRTRAVVISTPNNPTGHMFTRAELAEIAALCEQWNAVLISDEIYSSYRYGGNEHVSAAELPQLRDRSIVIGSLSKSHAVSGWRLGHLRAAPRLTEAVRQVHVVVSGGAPGPLQEAAARAAAAPGWTPALDLRPQRDRTLRLFEGLGFKCAPPDGGCYVMADIRPATDEDSVTLAFRMVEEAGVLVAPGRFFSTPDGPGTHCVRIAFNRRMELFDEVEKRLAGFRTTAAPPV